MFINPQIAIDEGWITGIKNPETQVQPNAIDFTLDTVYFVRPNSPFSVAEHGKVMRTRTEMPPVLDRATELSFWRFKPMAFYDCLSDVFVTVPEGVAAWLIARSTLTRNGVFLTSGLYDSGFQGHVGFVLNNLGGQTNITQGTRVGQVIFIKADSARVYTGSYSHKEGEAKQLANQGWVKEKQEALVADREHRKNVVEALEANTDAVDKQVLEEVKHVADVPLETTSPAEEMKAVVKKTSKKRRPAAIEAALDELKKPALDGTKVEEPVEKKKKAKKKKTKKKSTRGPAR